MAMPSYVELQRLLRDEAAELAALPPLRIAVLRNVVIEPIEPYLRYLARQSGFDARCRFGEYDNVWQEAAGGGSGAIDEATDYVLVFLRLDTLSWDLARRFALLGPDEIEAECRRIEEFAAGAIAGIRNRTGAMILWVGFETPAHPALGVLDYQLADGQAGTVRRLNDSVRSALRAGSDGYFIDPNPLIARLGTDRFYDPRYWHLARAPYSRAGLAELAAETFRFVRAHRGKNRKGLVLDCDNVLWGGTIGEDGLAGIKLGKTYPGSAYVEFQHELRNLQARGVILALCSKNEERDVWEVFESHPDMVLRREDIAAARINWEDKAENLRSLAAELNIGLDSLVFLDDSPFEIGRVQAALPEVTAIRLAPERAVEFRDVVLAGGWFDSLALVQEDRDRARMYRAEAARQELRTKVADLDEYLRSLEMVLTLRLADDFTVPRVAQLTQKTNQFNLTTRRYTEAEIAALARSESVDVITLQLGDRFGDAGLTGVAVLRYNDGVAAIDSFLLSCRVLGRGVEDAFLVQCLKRARSRGARAALGEYRPTRKNEQVREFYPRRGFGLTREDADAATFELELSSFDGHEPAFFARIDSNLTAVASADV